MLTRALSLLGARVLRAAAVVTSVAAVVWHTFGSLGRLDRREVFRCFYVYGYSSMGIVALVALMIGATVVLQTSLYVERFGARNFLGWAAGYSVLWEIGPLLLGMLLCSRIGSRNAAEIASLQVGGQIEGLRGISLDPFALLIAPRVLALTGCVLLLSVMVFAVAIFSEALTAYVTLRLPARVFFRSLEETLAWTDVLGGVTKSFAFGLAIAVVSTAAGLRARGGSKAVGRAAATAVIQTAGAIFALDFLLTPLLIHFFA